jgi:hypothetical protein
MTDKDQRDILTAGLRYQIASIGEQLKGATHGLSRSHMKAKVNALLIKLTLLDEVLGAEPAYPPAEEA